MWNQGNDGDVVGTLEELLTPPVVASLLGVSSPTVYSAFQRGEDRLCHIRTPGGQIRVRRRDLLAYCHLCGVQVPEALVVDPMAVLIHPDGDRGARLVEGLAALDIVTRRCCDDVEGLIEIGRLRPPVVLLSADLGEVRVSELARGISSNAHLGYSCVVTVTSSDRTSWCGVGPLSEPLVFGELAPRFGALVGALLGLRGLD